MKLHPHNKTVLCKCVVPEKEETIEFGIKFIKEQIPIYEVLEVSEMDNIAIKVGDRIVTNSIPTKLVANEEVYYIIRAEYIAGVIKENE